MNRIVEPLTDEERLALIAAARSYISVPFLHQGRTARGMDCIGLLGLSFCGIGRPMNARTDYGRRPELMAKKLERELRAHFGDPIPRDQMQPGDVVSMAWHLESNHVGIVTPHPERTFGVIHSYKSSERVIEHGMDSIWLSRITGVFRP